MFTQRNPEFFLLFPANVWLNAFLLLNIMFQKCVFPCRGTPLHMQYTTMRSLNQTPKGRNVDTLKVQGESQTTIFSFPKLQITSTCLSVCLSAYLKFLPKAKLKSDLHGVWFLYNYLCCSLFWFCYACAVWRILGLMDSLFQELKLIQILWAPSCAWWQSNTRCEGKHFPQQKPLQTFWDKKLLPRSWKHCRM